MSANFTGVGRGPACVDLHVAADAPAGLLETLQEGSNAGLKFPIVRSRGQENANEAHAFAVLRARRERPRDRGAAEGSQQFPPSDGDCHTPLPREARKWNDTTPRACSLDVQGGQDAGCFDLILRLPAASSWRTRPSRPCASPCSRAS